MDIDLEGRVRNTKLPLSRGLLPLFEAISNAIHSIEEAKTQSPEIVVEVIRDTSQGGLIDGEPLPNQPIKSFVVKDNGIGFTKDNFKSFGTSDSSKKQKKGGKGIGRFLWLKAFSKISVTSDFVDDKKKKKRRTFTFALNANGVQGNKVKAVDEVKDTQVRLEGFKPEYRDHSSFPKATETIGRKIIEHFLEYFVLGTCPEIILKDDYEKTSLRLKRVFESEMRLDVKKQNFKIKGKSFRIAHVRLLVPPELPHSLAFCANERSVQSEQLSRLLSNLESPLVEPKGNKRFCYIGYVAGKVLDESVNAERTRFETLDENEGTLLSDGISFDEILSTAVAKACKFLDPFTAPLNEAKKERIKEFVSSEAPQYRPLLKHKPERIDHLRSGLTDDQLDIELYKIGQEWDKELRVEYRRLLAEGEETVVEEKAFHDRYERFLEEWNEAGISKLARYVVHRKATLDFLEERLRLKADGKYPLEDAIHEIIFPLKATSEDIKIENMNLWIIDEKLAYHFYLASDKPLKQVEAVEVESDDRPDLLIFDRPFAFSESGPPFSAMVLVEFKRPARDDYSDKEEKSPILQVFDYIDQLKSGRAKDRSGRPISLPDHIPIYAYIVCDLTPTLCKQARNYSLTKTPDSQGYFGYHREHGAYIEVISFDKLVDDAKRRNKVLFEKLGIEQ